MTAPTVGQERAIKHAIAYSADPTTPLCLERVVRLHSGRLAIEYTRRTTGIRGRIHLMTDGSAMPTSFALERDWSPVEEVLLVFSEAVRA